jgi:transcriptional regulator with XRE-family HTH domain
MLAPACLTPKWLEMPVRGVVARLEELRTERGVNRKQIAGVLRKTRQAVDASLGGRTNMTVADAERVAASLGASLEVVIRNDATDEFRRVLLAQKDLSPVLRDAIWTLFEQATLERMRIRPKKVSAGSSRSSRGRPA